MFHALLAIKMKYLPVENIIYKTKLTSGEIMERIQKNIEPPKTLRMSRLFGRSDHKPYEGTVNGMSFSITRIIGYKNSFVPIIKGVIQNDSNGTRINVKMKLHPFVLIFTVIWCGGLMAIFLAFSMISLTGGTFEPISLMPIGMLFFGYGMTTGGFKYESAKSKKYLAQLFEAEVE